MSNNMCICNPVVIRRLRPYVSHRKTILRLTTLAFLSSLLLTACGSQANSEPVAETVPPVPETVASTTETEEPVQITEEPAQETEEPVQETEEPTAETVEKVNGCEDQPYHDPATSLYILPFAVGETFETGLTNCSSSYHGAGNPDQYAYDFDMPEGTPFIAARGGTVEAVVEDAPSRGDSGPGNYLRIDHHDGTFGLYYHSPEDGIDVEVGDEVEQGDVLGVTGRSGLAGYPHLHFIVVKGSPEYPYDGVAITFRNASPADISLKSYTTYTAEP